MRSDPLDECQPWYLRPENQPYIDLLLAIFRPEDWQKLQQLRRKDNIRCFSS